MAGRSGNGRGSSRPLNVEQIVKEAQNFEYKPLVPLKYWLRTASTLLREAEIYESEGNQQQTYLLLFRHATLVLNYLPKHPGPRSPEEKAGLLQAEKEVKTSLAKLDILKPQINKKYERYEKLATERATATENVRDSSQSRSVAPRGEWRFSDRGRRPSIDPMGTQAIAAAENRELAVKLARSEIKRRTMARKATRRAGIPEEVEQERRTAGVWGNWEEEFTNDEKDMDRDTLSQQMQNVRLQVDGKRSNREAERQVNTGPRASLPRSVYSYPTVPLKSQHQNGSLDTLARKAEPPTLENTSRPPTPPPKDDIQKAPIKPAKQPLYDPNSRPSSPGGEIQPSGYSFKPSAFLENGNPLRTIFLPPELRHRFLEIAEPNTRKNLETCGILCGTLISNALFISKLVIPQQKSTSDTCETENENLLFDYIDGEDLMMLGWIHTHPTQTCFMSSRDLHTHCGYQVMMPESIAIVCAPSKNPDWGVFRLTDPPGMPCVLNCTQTGLFHPHEETNIYTDALRPGHVFEAKGLDFEVYDMRNKS